MHRKKLPKILIVIFLLFILVVISTNLWRAKGEPIPKENVQYGFSFSPLVFTQSGLDWQSSYTTLLDRFNWRWVRVSFYWNQLIDDQGNLKLDDLWFQINEAQKRNVQVVLVIGAKEPYYPEVYLPQKLTKNFKFGEVIDNSSDAGKEILNLEKEIIPKLATSSAINYWQIENEPFAGPVNGWTVSEGLVKSEVDLIRSLDHQKRPIILTHPGPFVYDRDWQRLLPYLQPGDILGVNYFPKTRTPDIVTLNLFGKNLKIPWPESLNIPVYIWGPISPNFQRVAKKSLQTGNDLWIMEMQAEPYLIGFKESKGKIFVLKPKDIIKSDLQIRKYGIDHIGLWGANWWLLEEKRGNSDWIKAIETVVGTKTSN